MSLSTTVLDDERVAHLERELQVSRANEETSKAALLQIHQELKGAYLQIAQQQQKLNLLSKKLQTNRGSTESQSRVDSDTGFADLSRKTGAGTKTDATRPPVRVRPLLEDEAAVRINALWQKLPSWTKGMISSVDARFLDGIIKEVRPDQVYEVGVASGTSSALILSSMAEYADPSGIWLHSYDIAQDCYFDQSHAVGDATRAMVPDLLTHWKLNLGNTALDVPREKPAQTKSLYFIDANHSHPWPALDLIALLPGLKAGDCVVLHDINLPTITAGRFPDYGVQWLFDDWLGESLVPDVAVPNIGAFIIPEYKNLIRLSLEKTLSRPWPLQMSTKNAHVIACEASLVEFLHENKRA